MSCTEKKFINNWNNDKYILFFLERNVDVEVISKHIYWDAKEKLNTNEVSSILSTGFLATLFFLNSEKYKDYDIYLHGFSFEGWSGHAWGHERDYILALVDEQKVRFFSGV